MDFGRLDYFENVKFNSDVLLSVLDFFCKFSPKNPFSMLPD